MKQICLYIFYSLLLGACTSKSRHIEAQNKQDSLCIKPTDTIIPFSGLWISKAYVDSLKINKSPRKSQHLGWQILFPKKTGDTALVGNLHDAGLDEIIKIHGDYMLGGIHGRRVNLISPQKLMVDSEIYVPCSDWIQNNEYSSKIIESVLFAGRYLNSNKRDTAKFTSNGKIIGLSSFTSYQVMEDYYDEGRNIDQVIFTMNDGKSTYFAFKFLGDTLKLYDLKCLQYDSSSNQCAEVTFGKIRYTLIKSTPLE
jgi:hypothetical protein